MYDLVRGFMGDSSYMTNNKSFVESIHGGIVTINALRNLIIGIFALYCIPIISSLIFFRRCDLISEILISTPAFIFYSPTYLMILNIYALCRIDDTSWGTKGLDTSDSGRTSTLKSNWKKIRILHVCKFVFWNSVFGFILLLLADSYVIRFYLTFIIMAILGLTLFLKVFIGFIYIIIYKCQNSKCCSKEQ